MQIHPKSKIIFLIFILIICGRTTKSWADIGLNVKLFDNYGVPLFKDTKAHGLSMSGSYSPLLKISPSGFKRIEKIDSTGNYIQISEQILDHSLYLPAEYPLDFYLKYARKQSIELQWQKYKVDHLQEQAGSAKKRSTGLEIDIPVKIRHKAFQTIFGGDRVGLSVTGNITINGGFRHEKRSEVRTAINRGSDYNFKMEQTQQFRVTGNVGDKVKVSVDQDSERPFDFENTIKLDYDGYDDEIIKKIEAGNIALSLPATRFVSFSGKNSGLFGIKSQMTMGNLNVTAIASQEKGENKKLTYTGGSSEGQQLIKDYSYLKNVYFFLDKVYRDNYFPLQDGIHSYDPSRIIADIEVYVTTTEQDPQKIKGHAAADSAAIYEDDFTVTQEHVKDRYWARLDKNDYFVATDLGYIRLNNPISEDKILAVAYRDTSGRIYGEIPFDAQIDSIGSQVKLIHLKLIKPENPRPKDKTWNLMFRHIYSLGARNIDPEGFEAKIYFDPPSGDDQETIQTESGVKSFLEVFGLDKVDETGNAKPDNIIDDNINIRRLGMGELEFPSLRPFADVNNPYLPEDMYVKAMYDTTLQNEITRNSKFYIEVKSKSRSSTMQLGWNVIEGSEEVRLNGRVLKKGSDYIIDYYSGTLTVLDEQATSPSANLEVSYQRNELFQLEKKTLLGMRAEYNLWEDSFIGGTFIYLNQRTLDQKVRVGKGPMRNLIWDLNTSLNFEPNFLTKAVDALPLIQTKQPSSLKFEGEIAQILPNPNTLNSEETKDPDGVAYIDDFEAAKKETPLGVIQGGWTFASIPVQKKISQLGQLYWFNDYNMTPIQEIWPNKEVNPNTPNSVHVMSVVFTPNDSTDYSPHDSWAGIMRPLSGGYSDQSDSKFIELWVNGSVGNIHIDLGQITEDVIPNGKLNTEDKEVNGIRNGLLDEGEDLGIDGMAGRDPSDFWDINGNSIRDPDEPISWDDWEYNPNTGRYDKSNGTEGNENNVNGRIPDTEDINRNGTLDQVNNYFEYSFSLDKSSPDTIFISGDNDPENKEEYRRWYQYRIPLAEPDTIIGQPEMARLEFARIWVDGYPSKALIRIAEINVVGNDWKEQGIAAADDSTYDDKNDTTVVATVINSHDNPDYVAPPGVSGVRDRITRVEAKEQSLVIKINSLPPGYNGILQKTFFEAENYIHYDKLKMYVHGGDAYGTNFFPAYQDTSQIEIFLRFGANENNYYEIRQPVYQDWDGNNMEVELSELTQLKFEIPDSIHDMRSRKFPDGKEWRIVGQPSLTNIKQLMLGVKNRSKLHYFTGEVWVNELRLSGVHKDKGYATRARVDFKLADVFSLNAEIDRKDADFHNINTRFGSGDNQTSMTIGTGFQLHKFLPRSWGFSLPVTFNYKSDESTPKYLPGSDILVTPSTPDSVIDVIKRKSNSIGYGISFRKTTKSNNFFIKNTIDNLNITYNGAESYSSDSKTVESRRKTYTANINYALNFDSKANFQPLSWLGNIPIIKKLSEMKFYYLPTGLTLQASGNQTKTYSLTRSGLENTTRPFSISRTAQTGYSPFSSLSFDFSRTHRSDLTNTKQPKQEILKGKFGQLTSVDQSASAKYNPRIFSWLTTNFSYSASYKWTNNLQLQNTGTGRSASVNNSMTGTFNFDPNKLISSFKGKPKQKGSPKGKQTSKDKPKTENQFIKVLKGIVNVPRKLQPISINYTQRDNISYTGLEQGTPSFGFMLGFDDSTGLGIVEGVGTNSYQFRRSENLTLQSGLKISNDIDLSLRFSTDKSRNETTQITGDLSESSFKISKDKDPIRFPEWTVRWTGLEKIAFLKKVIQRVSLDHSFSGKTTKSWQGTTSNHTRKSYASSFRPLIGFNITWKNNISTTIRYNSSINYDETVRGTTGASRTLGSDFSIQGSYSRSGGFRIPIPVWPFKNKELKNNIDISLAFNINKNVTEQNVISGKWEEITKTAKWSFKPQMSYRFSNNVSGGMYFEYGKNENKRMGTTSFQDFGINVRIEIRGG